MSGASAIFILDLKGRVIISRNYRGDVPMNIAEHFYAHVIEQDDSLVRPVFVNAGITYCWIKYNNLYILGVTQRNSNSTMLVTFLYKLANLLCAYFNELEEESIRDNFTITYELLDEIMDNGYPQSTEVQILQEFIKNEAHRLTVDKIRPPTAITNAVSWRSEGIKHKKDEIFLDIIEKLNILVSSSGTVLRSEIIGTLKMKSFLSGMPELLLGLNDKLQFDGGSSSHGGNDGVSSPGASTSFSSKAIAMEDIKFHQCVRLAQFENNRTISFIPPDGEFELMNYRLNSHVKPLFWIEAVVDAGRSSSRIEYLVKARSQFKNKRIANNVEIHIPVPPDVDSPYFKTHVGTIKYLPESNSMVWSIRQFQGQRDFVMSAEFGLPSISDESRDSYTKRPIVVHFEMHSFAVSGIYVRNLKIYEKSGYRALPWVRYITKDGDYQLRMT